MTDKSFSDLGLPAPLLAAVEELGFEAPSAIQAAAIPAALQGKNLVGLSETGSGKTAAFGLVGLSRLDPACSDVQLLVVCPTRELAVQVCGEIQRLGAKLPHLHCTPIYGGTPIDRQFRALRNGVHVVVGTPGRLLDHLKRGTLNLSTVRTAVLDEADRMLDMGFVDEMEEILRQLPKDHQALFFSATMNRGVERLIKGYGNDPQLIQIERKSLTVESIDQMCFEVRHRSRIELVSRIVDLDRPKLTLVFCNTKRTVDECTEALLARGYSADRLHGDIAQSMRERVLRLFREGTVEILVATDVAARGIDIDDIDLVINYELPQDPEDYVHRIGRTGRAGRDGKAVSFTFGRDAFRIRTIERFIRQPIPKATIPTKDEVESHLADQLLETLATRLLAGTNEAAVQSLSPLRDLGHDWDAIASTLLDMVKEMTTREGEEIVEDNAKPPQQNRRERERRETRSDSDDFEQPRDEPSGAIPVEHSGSGMVTLFLNLGKRHHVNPGDIVGMLHNQCHLERGTVGHIKLMPGFSLVDVRADCVSQAIEGSQGAKLRGKHFKIDLDRGAGGAPRGGERDDRGGHREGRRGGGRRDERRGGGRGRGNSRGGGGGGGGGRGQRRS